MTLKITYHKPEDFAGMRAAGAIAASVLEYIEPFVKPGVTTSQINDLCHEYIIKKGAIPAPLNYRGFPKSVCTSVNHVVCHGVPNDDTVLMDGYIMNIDVTVIFKGWHGDTSKTFLVGDSFKANKGRIKIIKNLVNSAYEAMKIGIEASVPGNKISDIGIAIAEYARKKGYSSVEDYSGHGIGKTFHADPYIIHYNPKNDYSFQDCEIKPGMFFTVEPMLNMGTHETTLSKVDGWTVFSKDHKLSAQFEHTIGITEKGNEIFTLRKEEQI